MSGSTEMSGKAPKAMSSRLLTMKFMQRAAASSPTTNTNTNTPSPSTPDEPSPKRRKTAENSPMPFNVQSLTDQKAVQEALAKEEAKRVAALDRQAALAGDTRWVLNFKGDEAAAANGANGIAKTELRVVAAGFAAIDEAALGSGYEGPRDAVGLVGRKSFGRFNKVIEKLQDPEYETSSSESSDSESPERSDADDDADPETTALIKEERDAAYEQMRAERKANKKAKKEEMERLSKERNRKTVNLNNPVRLKSISSGGLGGGGRKSGGETRNCFNCDQPGHLKEDCPKPKRKRLRSSE